MKVTITLDDDVAALTRRVRDASGRSLDATINDALRLGLTGLLEADTEGCAPQREPAPPAQRYRTPSVDLGRCLVENLDDVAEVLASAEGEGVT